MGKPDERKTLGNRGAPAETTEHLNKRKSQSQTHAGNLRKRKKEERRNREPMKTVAEVGGTRFPPERNQCSALDTHSSWSLSSSLVKGRWLTILSGTEQEDGIGGSTRGGTVERSCVPLPRKPRKHRLTGRHGARRSRLCRPKLSPLKSVARHWHVAQQPSGGARLHVAETR